MPFCLHDQEEPDRILNGTTSTCRMIMKTLSIIFVVFLFTVSSVFAWGLESGCSGSHKEVTLAEQSSDFIEVLVVRIDGMEVHQLTSVGGKVFFNILDVFGEELAKGLDRDQLAEQFPEIFKALSKS